MNNGSPQSSDADTVQSAKLLQVPDADLLATMLAADISFTELADPFEEDEDIAPTVSWVA